MHTHTHTLKGQPPMLVLLPDVAMVLVPLVCRVSWPVSALSWWYMASDRMASTNLFLSRSVRNTRRACGVSLRLTAEVYTSTHSSGSTSVSRSLPVQSSGSDKAPGLTDSTLPSSIADASVRSCSVRMEALRSRNSWHCDVDSRGLLLDRRASMATGASGGSDAAGASLLTVPEGCSGCGRSSTCTLARLKTSVPRRCCGIRSASVLRCTRVAVTLPLA
mmetsp:Transcript_36251/g.90505  ORF Transcript_36251/g.90505 Transcript_36251/m.90505 type:complete len:219 (+) Transcript_36251:158-814(+)